MTAALRLPVINDITTNPEGPVEFDKIKELQANTGKDLSYPKEFHDLQKSHYPDIQPLYLTLEPLKAFDICLSIVKQRQWEIINFDEAQKKIECVVTTNMMKFKDDVVIQVFTNGENQTRIEMRSKSRVGKGDLGANAKRITAFLTDTKIASEDVA